MPLEDTSNVVVAARPVRVWTRGELDSVHPLPEGCSWRFTYGGAPAVVFTDASGELVEVVFEGGQVLASVAHGQPYEDDIHEGIALPLILASKGLDSLGAMAAALDGRATAAERDAKTAGQPQYAATGGEVDAAGYEGEAAGLRYAAAMLARLAGSAICRATCIGPGETVVEDSAEIAEHALTSAVEALRTRAEVAEAEVTRLRARVRVEADDVERAGVTWRHVEAWLVAAGWHKFITAHGWKYSPAPSTWDGVLASGTRNEISRAINIVAERFGRPGLDILDEMAAMEVAP